MAYKCTRWLTADGVTRHGAFYSYTVVIDRIVLTSTVIMQQQPEQTSNSAKASQPLTQPAVTACNFLKVLNFPGRVLTRRFVLDPSLPRQQDAPFENILVNCGSHAALDADIPYVTIRWPLFPPRLTTTFPSSNFYTDEFILLISNTSEAQKKF